MALILTMTQAGREAIVNADRDGTATVRVRSVGITAQAFAADPSMTALPGETKRIDTISGGVTAPDTIHVTVRDATSDTYAVRGIGLYLDDGTLFAAYGQAEVVAEKSSQAVLLMAVDVQFVDIDAASLTFGDTNFELNIATTEKAGVVELATIAETQTGTDDQRVVTPAALQASRYAPGQIVVSAGKAALPGTLPCSGGAVSRTQYARLFAVIGTIYGAGDGTTTFNVPAVKEDTVIKHTNDPDKVGSYTAGQVIAHTHDAAADTRGRHTHTAAIDYDGNHAHALPAELLSVAPPATAVVGGSGMGIRNNVYSTDWSGPHTHGISIHEQGEHTHAVEIAAVGGEDNLPAGLRMMYCIAY